MSVAIVLGGAVGWDDEMAAALELCAGRPYQLFATNDLIAEFGEPIDHAVTLHMTKLAGWLTERERRGYSAPHRVWGPQPKTHQHGIDCDTSISRDSWQGSVSLYAAKIALIEMGFRRAIVCGAPLDPLVRHFKRGKEWPAALHFRNGWNLHKREITPFIRSMSGWTRALLGEPTREWILSGQDPGQGVG